MSCWQQLRSCLCIPIMLQKLTSDLASTQGRVSAKTSSLYQVQETLTELQGELEDTKGQKEKMEEHVEQLKMQLGVAKRHIDLLQEVGSGQGHTVGLCWD